jgi:4-amino-4-deoxy-L-arabinose transferase-like glycosyltransferase
VVERSEYPLGRFDPWLPTLCATGLALRLIGLDEPLIDQQAWRQADTAAMARNFFVEGYDLLRPRVDWRGISSGVVETNFPLYPYLVACLYGVAGGASEWLGRLLSALFSSLAAVPVYALGRRLSPGPWLARCAAAIYLVLPLSWYFGRAVMPEALMILLSGCALWTFQRWLEAPTRLRFVTATIAAGLCFAVKIPTLYLGFPLLALAMARHGWGFLRRPSMWVFLVAALLPAVMWYGHAVSLFRETGLTFGIFGSTGYDKWAHGLLLKAGFWSSLAERFTFSVLTPAGVVLVAVGLAGLWPTGRQGRQRWYLYAWLGGLLFYLLLVPEGNRKLHYYQLPFVPLAALFAAAPLAALLGEPVMGTRLGALMGRAGRGGRWWAAAILAGVVVASAHEVSAYRHPPTYGYYKTCLAAGRALDAKLPRDARVVVGDLDDNAGTPFRAQSPTLLYYLNRKGWQITPAEFAAATLDSLALMGAEFFVVPGGFVLDKPAFWAYLLRRGVATAASFPETWYDGASFLEGANRHPGPERHLLVVRL